MSDSILIVAGETSGEEHAAGLVTELRNTLDRSWSFFGAGGRRMAEAGVELLEDVSRLAAIGPWEAAGRLKDYWKLYRLLLREARSRRPRLALLVDFPDFNLPLARRLKDLNILVCYFISPQVWAWRESRVKQIRRRVDAMLVIFPFEEAFYRRRGVQAWYVGNPTRARLREAVPPSPRRESSPHRVALLPGSRPREVSQLLPVLLDAAHYLAQRKRVEFWLLQAPAIPFSLLQDQYTRWSARRAARLDLEIRQGEIGRLLPEADCAIIKSGTSTLEAMILQVPFVMVYRLSWPSWFLLRPLVRAQTFCLANLVAGERVVREFVQWGATAERIGKEVLRLLEDDRYREQLRERLARASQRLGEADAYREAARHVLRLLNQEASRV